MLSGRNCEPSLGLTNEFGTTTRQDSLALLERESFDAEGHDGLTMAKDRFEAPLFDRVKGGRMEAGGGTVGDLDVLDRPIVGNDEVDVDVTVET